MGKGLELINNQERKEGKENMKKNYFYKAKIKSTQGLEDRDFIQGNLAQELSTGEVGERGINYEIEKTKVVSCVNGFVTSGFSFDCVVT